MYQWLRFENYSRKQQKTITRKGGKQVACKNQRTVKEILDEADRVAGNHPHVAKAQKPRVIFGCSIDELRQMHDAVDDAVVAMKNGKSRKIRITQNTLATCVMSYPVPVSDIKTKEQKADYFLWREKSIEFLKAIWGDDFKCAVQHLDESYPHIHCYGLTKDFDVSRLHPGMAAAKESKKTGKDLGRVAVNGLKKTLDDYQDKVGKFFAMDRIGAGRLRLTRAEKMARDAESKRQARLFRQAEKLAPVVEQYENVSGTVSALAGGFAAGLKKGGESFTKSRFDEGARSRDKEVSLLIEKNDELTKDKKELVRCNDDLRRNNESLKNELKEERLKEYEKDKPFRELQKSHQLTQSILEQLVNHCVDNNFNPYKKFKLILSDEELDKLNKEIVKQFMDDLNRIFGNDNNKSIKNGFSRF